MIQALSDSLALDHQTAEERNVLKATTVHQTIFVLLISDALTTRKQLVGINAVIFVE